MLVQFGNNWIQKIPLTAKLDLAYGLVQFWLSSEFFSSNYFQIGQHVVLLQNVVLWFLEWSSSEERENLSCCYPPPYKKVGLSIMDLGPLNFGGIFSCEEFFWEISKPPTNKDLAFVTVPFSFMTFMLRWHFRRFFCDTLHVLRREKQTWGHTILKYREKIQVNKRVKGISHI